MFKNSNFVMKKYLPIIIPIIIIAAGIGGYYLYDNYYPNIEQPIENNIQEAGFSGLYIAEKIYDYIQTQRNLDGFYKYASNCEEGCVFYESVFNNANTWPTYASVGMYQATKDDKFLIDARRDADRLLAWCDEDPTECIRVTYQVNALGKETGDKKYIDFVVKEADVFLDPENSEIIQTDVVMLKGIDSIQLAQAYDITNNKKYLDASLNKLSESENLLVDEKTVYGYNNNLFRNYACWPNLAKLELYKSTEDSKYLMDVINFADGINLPNNIHQLWFMSDIQPCIDLHIQLYQITNDDKYLEGSQKMVETILLTYWDDIDNPKLSGSNAIKSTIDQDWTSITDSSYMIYLLSQIQNERFDV